jgi:hypothetical protein
MAVDGDPFAKEEIADLNLSEPKPDSFGKKTLETEHVDPMVPRPD